MIPVGLDYLAEMYESVQERKKEIRAEVRERYKKRADEEIARLVELEDSRIGVALVRAVEQGYKRADIAKVIKTNDSAKYRRLVELGGGKIRTHITADERQAERAESINVTDNRDGTFNLFTGRDSESITIEVHWKNGKPYIWPVDVNDVVVLRDKYGYDQAKMYGKGAEIVSAFGLEEPNV